METQKAESLPGDRPRKEKYRDVEVHFDPSRETDKLTSLKSHDSGNIPSLVCLFTCLGSGSVSSDTFLLRNTKCFGHNETGNLPTLLTSKKNFLLTCLPNNS